MPKLTAQAAPPPLRPLDTRPSAASPAGRAREPGYYGCNSSVFNNVEQVQTADIEEHFEKFCDVLVQRNENDDTKIWVEDQRTWIRTELDAQRNRQV